MAVKIPLLEFSCKNDFCCCVVLVVFLVFCFFSGQGDDGKIGVCCFKLLSLWWWTLHLIWIHFQVCKTKTWAFVLKTKMGRSYEKVVLKKWEGMREQSRTWLVTETVNCFSCSARNTEVCPMAGSWKRAVSILERKMDSPEKSVTLWPFLEQISRTCGRM